MRIVVWVLAFVVLVACQGEHRAARELYNQGVASLAKGEYEQAQKQFLEARSTAGVDPELRFRAAYDLGIAFAAHADKVRQGEEADLEKALDLAQQAASWLADAARLRKGDANTQANLAIVRARVQSISDQLRAAEGTLEARLDKLIEEQREILDDARLAWLEIKQAGGTDPLAQQSSLTHLADRERGVVAEAGVLQDISADEIDAIGKKTEDKRTDEEKVRLIQLKNLDLYLLDARNAIADARRRLQSFAAEEGVNRAEAALVALKRGREQLLDPITVMKGVAQDQVGVLRETTIAAAADGSLRLQVEQQLPPPDQMPAWLAPAAIAERQNGLRDRIEEVRARLEAATSTPPPDPSTLQDPKAQQQAAQQAELLARVKLAVPSVIEASSAMAKAVESLRASKAKAAIDHERAAILALMQAIEQFAELKHLIELAYNDQKGLVELLGPEAAKRLPADERATETKGALERNLSRMPRMKALIAEQLAQAEKAPPPPEGDDPKQAEAQKQQIEQMKQQLALAETLRGQAETALQTLQKAIAANADPIVPARDGEAKLAELRKLFFNIIEHLQQLIRDQGDTLDRTRQANTEDMFGREAKLPDLVQTQTQHGDLAKALTEALAAQADAAGKEGAPQQPGQPDAKTYAAAANEVRQAQQEMADATRVLTTARDDKQKSHSLDPATRSQDKANEHLKEALKLLQPPQKGDKDDKKQEQQQQQQQQQQPQEQKPQGGAQQRARDEDARRQRERQQQQQQSGTEEMDW